MSRNSQLEAENKRLFAQVEEMKEICSLTSTLNVKYKLQLDRQVTDKENLLESNHKLKLKLNTLTVKCNELDQIIKVLEANLRRKPVTKISFQPQVRVISSVSEIMVTKPLQNEALHDLQKRFDELDVEHQEALNVIDELEFELGDVIAENFSRRHSLDYACYFLFMSGGHQIDYLEMETKRLQQENAKLKEMLQQTGNS